MCVTVFGRIRPPPCGGGGGVDGGTCDRGRVGGGARGDELAVFESHTVYYYSSKLCSAYHSPGSPSGLVARDRDNGVPAGGGGGVTGGWAGASSVVASTA